ncbi:MAG: exodeoxyribonuclease V subunit gamma [Desulfobacter sp.]|nr:MAG: exodeoxyribonuclease V subunit gamma [Desulfobacter sp.]
MASRNTGQRPGLTPGLSIIHSNHLEHLRQVVVEWIKSHPLDVLETEQFLVQSNGMAQWLKLALADDSGCGISAGLEVNLPGRYVWTAYRAVLGDNIPENSPYDKERIKWRLFRLLPGLRDEPVFAPLNRFLEGDKGRESDRRLSQLAAHLADLFDQYQVYRADWLEDWGKGRDQLARIAGPPMALPRDQLWQAELWRRIRTDIPEHLRQISRSDLHQNFMKAALALGDARPSPLPPRVMVFGISSLPRQVIETLHAVSGLCQVLLFVQNPCRHFWADIIEDRDLLRISNARHPAKADMPDPLSPDQLHQHANPLLAAWGKQGRDYIGLLYGYDAPETYEKEFPQIDLFEDFVRDGEQAPLLNQVQQAVLDLTPLPPAPDHRPMVAADDPSIRFAAAHSRQREVEILQDMLLHYFETLEGLKPGDIMVMAADIDAYAPHIEAVFGNMPADDDRFIPFTIADKPDRESLPLVTAVEKLFFIPDSRMGVSEIIDLLEVPAFRAGFGLGAEDLPRLVRWIEGAGISWGLTPDQREDFGMPRGLDQNTWAFGLDRMLLGYAVGQGEAWADIEPYDEVGGLDAALVGPLSDLVREMEHLRQILGRPAAPAQWCTRIREMVQTCFRASEDRDLITLNRLEEVLDDWLDACTQAELDQDISLEVVRELVMEKMAAAGVSQRFLAGMVNFGTLMPMRAIPFRVVCLLGMNDGEFPRSHPPLDFDLMAGRGMYRPGDRSRREDDRYLFLEALLSARDRLYISYVGRNIRDNSERMPSVLVGQLRDYLEAGWQMAGDPAVPLGDSLTTIYPLQPFGKEYFNGAAPQVFTYAHEWRKALDTGGEQKSPVVPLEAPGEIAGPGLADLVRFMKNPVRYFFGRRLSVRFDEGGDRCSDLEPFALDGLAPFNLGERLLRAGLAVPDRDAREAMAGAARRMMRTGELPMAGFGRLAAKELLRPVNRMLDHHHELRDQWPHACDPLEISLALATGDGRTVALDDWLDRIHGAGDKICRGRWEFYPKPVSGRGMKPEQLHTLVGLWIRHLAGSAAGAPLESVLVTPEDRIVLPPLPGPEALGYLSDIAREWLRGLTLPLPITAKTGLAYAARLDADGEKARMAALKAYEGDGFNFSGELGYDPCLRRVYPGFEELWAAFDNEFTRLCRVLYAPLARAVSN